MSEEGEYASSEKYNRDVNEYKEEKYEEEEEEDENDKEMLFLIEFLVDTLCINFNNLNLKRIDPCILTGQNSVVLTFLNFPPMTLCEKDLAMDNDDNTDDMIKFNAGKSLMFALSESQFSNPPPIYLEVAVHKMLPHGLPDSSLPIGKTKICLSELFKQVFDKIDENPDKLPISKSIKDSYPLGGINTKKPAGDISIYIRLSCLGQNIVTEFQRGGDECDPFLFKNKESNKVYECKPKDEMLEGEVGDMCPSCPGTGGAGSKQKSCSAASGGGGFGGGGYSAADMDEDEFEEFGTEVHGHALTLKIQKSRNDRKKGNGGGSGPGNQITFEVPQNQKYCGGENSSSKTKIYPMKGCSQMDGPMKITAGPNDCNDKDIFVLRIGKKGEINGKGKLELELRTPKIKKDKGPTGPKMVHKEVQTDKEDSGKKGKKKKK